MLLKHYDGSNPQAMHNYYTYLYNKAVFELLKEVKGEKEAVCMVLEVIACHGCLTRKPAMWLVILQD